MIRREEAVHGKSAKAVKPAPVMRAGKTSSAFVKPKPSAADVNTSAVDDVPRRTGRREVDTFDLNIRFHLAHESGPRTSSATRAACESNIRYWNQVAETHFDTEPALKITPTFNWAVPVANSFVLEVKNERQAAKWMDDTFDNVVGERRDEGSLEVLIVAGITVTKGDGFDGKAFFPHANQPFGRKHGIVLTYTDDVRWRAAFAHELGHMFGLKHTWETYWGLGRNCNKDFGARGTTVRGGLINLMDYDHDKSGVRGFYLNDCQKDRAATQRKQYSTRDGKTNYRKLKGLR